jgi:hypothetical protein
MYNPFTSPELIKAEVFCRCAGAASSSRPGSASTERCRCLLRRNIGRRVGFSRTGSASPKSTTAADSRRAARIAANRNAYSAKYIFLLLSGVFI